MYHLLDYILVFPFQIQYNNVILGQLKYNHQLIQQRKLHDGNETLKWQSKTGATASLNMTLCKLLGSDSELCLTGQALYPGKEPTGVQDKGSELPA